MAASEKVCGRGGQAGRLSARAGGCVRPGRAVGCKAQGGRTGGRPAGPLLSAPTASRALPRLLPPRPAPRAHHATHQRQPVDEQVWQQPRILLAAAAERGVAADEPLQIVLALAVAGEPDLARLRLRHACLADLRAGVVAVGGVGGGVGGEEGWEVCPAEHWRRRRLGTRQHQAGAFGQQASRPASGRTTSERKGRRLTCMRKKTILPGM
jgi:hypothetical protein